MKQEKIDTPKTTLEQRITAALSAEEASSVELATLIAGLETEVSQVTKKVELQRALDINTDITVAHREITQNELVRTRLRSVLPQLQQKFREAALREFEAEWNAEYNRLEILRDAMGERWCQIPTLFKQIISIFDENEALQKEISNLHGQAVSGESRRLLDAELLWRDLKAFSGSQPPLATVTKLPDYNQPELPLYPPRAAAFAPFSPAPIDVSYTEAWGKARDGKRKQDNARIDRELELAEQQKREFYQGR